jgi:hypothetical protein
MTLVLPDQRETCCYAWHGTRPSHLLGMRPSLRHKAPGSLSQGPNRQDSLSPGSARRRVVPWGRETTHRGSTIGIAILLCACPNSNFELFEPAAHRRVMHSQMILACSSQLNSSSCSIADAQFKRFKPSKGSSRSNRQEQASACSRWRSASLKKLFCRTLPRPVARRPLPNFNGSERFPSTFSRTSEILSRRRWSACKAS